MGMDFFIKKKNMRWVTAGQENESTVGFYIDMGSFLIP